LIRGQFLFTIIFIAMALLKPNNQIGLNQPMATKMDAVCEGLLADLTSQPGWLEELIDPVLLTEDEITDRLNTLTPLHSCLDPIKDILTDEQSTIHRLAEYFLIFAGGYQTPNEGSELVLVDLAASDDPAIVELRDEAGLAPPPGYVFFRLYESRQSMPPRVVAIFSDRQVAGVTINTRYIAVLAETPSAYQRQILQRQALPRTISHELVHAYVHSRLQPAGLGRMPEWFNEGVAIYFSKSGENHTLITPNAVLVHTTTAEYLQYKQNFDFLEDQLGRERLLGLIVSAIDQGEPALVYRELGIENERLLASIAAGWRERQTRQAQVISLVSVILLAVLVVWLVPSEVRCTCGFAGRKSDFENGYCPRCRKPINRVNQVIRRRPRRIYAACDVCRQWFWLWNKSRVRPAPTGLNIWTSSDDGEPVQLRIKESDLICENCSQRSIELGASYSQKMRSEMEETARQTEQIYRSWLNQAPRVSIWFRSGLQIFSYDDALNQLKLAALKPAYQNWLGQEPEFEFRVFFEGATRDFTRTPPSGYENVLKRTVRSGEDEVQLLGTVRRIDNENIGIQWVTGSLSF
jgi:hypothetical protein